MPSYPFRTALITGASSGIGEAMVRLLALDGVACIAVARRADRLDQLAAELSGVEAMAADLRDPADLARVCERVASGDQPVDLVVNNAGFGTSGSFHTLDADRTAGEIELNVVALTRLSRAATGAMAQRRRGWLLNVSSVASFQPGPGLAVYAATKAYVTSFTEAIHEELRPHDVVATALCPGLTRTEFQSVSNSEGFTDKYPAAAWLTAEHVARAGLDDCATGRALSIPGVQYKAIVAATRPIPRTLVRRIAGKLTVGRQ